MDDKTIELIKTVLIFVLPALFTWLGKRWQIPKSIRLWYDQVQDSDIIDAINEGAKFAEATKAERQEIARKYLQERIDGLPSSAANWLIENMLQLVFKKK